MTRHAFSDVRHGLSRCRLCGLEARTIDNGPAASPRWTIRYRRNVAGRGRRFQAETARMPSCR